MPLLADLERLGDKIVSADLPVDARKILGALVHAIEQTGWQIDLKPPEAPTDRAEAQQINEDQAEIARLRTQLAEAQAAQAPPAPAAAAPEGPEPPASGAAADPPAPPAVSA
jgi:hypothetical protein